MKSRTWQEIRGFSADELELKLRESRETLAKKRFQHATTPLKNALEIRSLRRMVARLETLLRTNALAAQAPAKEKHSARKEQ